MPRLLDPVLAQAHQRANPVTCDIVEISAPDAARVLRRANDQFFTATPTGPRVSETPGGSTAADAKGALILAPTSTQIASFYTENSEFGLPAAVDPSTNIKGVGWTMPMTFGRVALRRFTARIRHASLTPLDLELRIYRPKIQRYFWRNPVTGAFEERRGVSFLEILPEPVVVRYAAMTFTLFHADVVFDLSHIRPELSPGPLLDDPIAGDADALNPHYIFQINPVNPPRGNIMFWKIDQTTAIDVPTMGRFQEITWSRPANRNQDPLAWSVAKQNYCDCCKLEIETYAPTATVVYAIDVGKVPDAAGTVRAVFERGVPAGGTATLELSTAGSGGPWTAVKHGDAIATKQQLYHLRLVLTAPSGNRHTPRVRALGLESRVVQDVSAEVTLDPVVHEIEVPYLAAAIGEGSASVVRHGRRDYRDIGSEIAVTYPVSKLELDHHIGSRHAKVSRDRWIHYDRAAVTNREPIESAERFGLLSPLKALKKKIPARIETINTVHTVQAGTTDSAVIVAPNLSGAAGTGDYAGQGYYLRVRSSIQEGTPPGYIQTIDSNTNLNTLNFTTALPGTLVAGDVIEVHSAQFAQPTLEWVDADPADIWWELLTLHLLIPAERIGFAGMGQASRSGLPPRVTDRAPGDATTQGKLKVTLRLHDAQEADRLIDQVSFLMGGCTIAIGGQYVFRQIYPLRNADGDITVPTATPEIAFDARDYANLQAPTGLEQRINTLACDYGVNTTVLPETSSPSQTVVFQDGDAIAYLAEQDVEGLGNAAIPKEIARWCYNSADAGRLLAEHLTRQVVSFASTGLRVWSWTAVDAHPELLVGDTVWVVTDQYTDYDPTRKLAIRGWWAFQLIIVQVANGGRRFRGFMPGLGSATQLRGGTGTLTADGSEIGPSLNVTAVPGATNFTINYSVDATTFEYSIDGAAFGIVPPTGFTVTRPSAGANDKTLSFRAVKNGQEIVDTITVPAVDKDTVTPDLAVTQTAQDETTTSFQASATNPAGGAAPTITFSLANTTAQGYSGAGPHTIASGTTVVVNRPTLASNQATVKFRAAIAGSGAEEISRTIPNTTFDPASDPENMVGNGGGQTGAVGANAPGWTHNVGNNLVIASDTARFGDRSLKISNPVATQSSDFQSFSVEAGGVYEASGWIAGDTVVAKTPELQLGLSAGSFEVLDAAGGVQTTYSASAVGVGPGTGTYPFLFVRIRFRVTASATLNFYCAFGNGGVNASGTAWFDGMSLKRLIREAPNLRVWAVEGSTSYTIFYETDSDATLVYRTDNGSDSTPPASGFTVSRNAFGGAAKVLTFTATRAGHTAVVSISVPPKGDPAAGVTANVDALFWVSTNYTDDEITMQFNWSGAIGGGAFKMYRIISAGTTPDLSGTQTLIYNSNGASPVTVIDAPSAGDIQSTTGPKKTFSYQVRVVDVDGNVLRSSEWVHRTETVV